MTNILTLDIETTISNDGNPFDITNSACLVGLSDSIGTDTYDIEYGGRPFGETLQQIQKRLDVCDLLVGFNIKFDLHWLRRYGIKFDHCLLWDCQYAEYCLSGQSLSLPSLENTVSNRNLGHKFDIVKLEYWDKGINTPLVPLDILTDYLKQDLALTRKIYDQQIEELKNNPRLKRLIWQGCQDIRVTEEMEWNGLKYDLEQSTTIGDKYLGDIANLDSVLRGLCPNDQVDFGNHWDLSAILYGGVIKYKVRETYSKLLKSGKTVIKEHNVEKTISFPKLVEPLENTRLKREGGDWFATDEKTLRKLKAFGTAKQIIDIILERAKLSKKVSTYFHGFPKKYEEMHWENSFIHGQLIHCRSATGRLASSKPNIQNMDEEQLKCVVTRFPNANQG